MECCLTLLLTLPRLLQIHKCTLFQVFVEQAFQRIFKLFRGVGVFEVWGLKGAGLAFGFGRQISSTS